VQAVPLLLDAEQLRALSDTPDAYGAALTAMLFVPALREAWREARGYRAGVGGALRVRLFLDGPDTLHALRWELLHDPDDGAPLAYNERVRLSRFLASPRLVGTSPAPQAALRAVVAVANPPALPNFQLSPLDLEGEVARACQGLGGIEPTILDGRQGRLAATLPALAAALRDGAQILYLGGGGTLGANRPLLWLEQAVGPPYKPVAGDELVRAIARLERPPLLVVLASCQGAGNTYATLAAVGPGLARAGVGAVIAM